MKNENGLTLIELLVYTVILSVVATLGISSFSIIRDSALKADAGSIVNDIRNIKELSLMNAEEYKIVFYKDHYEIQDSRGAIKKTYIFQRKVELIDNELNRGSQKVNYMGYTLDETAQASGTLIISNGKNKMKISITPVTGRVLLSKI